MQNDQFSLSHFALMDVPVKTRKNDRANAVIAGPGPCPPCRYSIARYGV
jgi:hypothetical protein